MTSMGPTTLLTEEQRRMYAAEKLENFRWISKIVATYSPYTLTDADLASVNLHRELAEIGQFAEIVYSAKSISIEYVFANSASLSQPGLPLEHYDAIRESILVDSFQGGFADLPTYIAYRPSTSQLIVSISGTTSVQQAVQDLRVLRTPHPSGRGSVHSGFWTLYQGIKPKVIQGIQKGVETHSPAEIVLTGHSMGGSIAYLLCIDLLSQEDFQPFDVRMQVTVFGSPRTGDSDLISYFHELIALYRKRKGNDNHFKEYAVKGYNDGVPTLPPTWLGYRHFCQEPIYTVGGKLYRTPSTECEHALFRVVSSDDASVPLFPKGGHNYYNGRDLEKFLRQISWLDRAAPEKEGWEDRYMEILRKFL